MALDLRDVLRSEMRVHPRLAQQGLFEGAEARDCSIELPNDMVIEMDGLRFLRAWALPHFYFHVVTAYDILRHNGVVLAKSDFLGPFDPK